MTLDEAYTVLGVSRYSALADIQQAYQSCLKQLQLRLSTCTSPLDRQKVQNMIKQLVEALGVIQKNAAQNNPVPPITNQKTSAPQTSIPRPRSGTNRHPKNTHTSPSTTQVSGQNAIIPLGIATFLMLLVAILCTSSYSNYKAKSMGMLRVISVPWCEVELDGKSLGPSGQQKAFIVVKGNHKLVLRKGDRTLIKRIRLDKDKLTIVNVQFKQGHIYVKQQ